jgi:CheY-like chemotaxis protein
MNRQGKNYIILADDDEDDRFLFMEVVKELYPAHPSIDVRIAEDGFELLNFLEKPGIALPELILLDLNMPLINGFECLEVLKKDLRLKDIPVIIYSTSSRDEDKRKAYELGASHYIEKPKSFTDLKDVLRPVLQSHWESMNFPPRENSWEQH